MPEENPTPSVFAPVRNEEEISKICKVLKNSKSFSDEKENSKDRWMEELRKSFSGSQQSAFRAMLFGVAILPKDSGYLGGPRGNPR